LRYPTPEMLKRRGPFTDPRDGRLLREIDCAFAAHNGDVLTTTVLLNWCYGARVIRKLAGDPSWHREMVKRAALKICIPLGRSTKGSGRPMMWKLDPEKAALVDGESGRSAIKGKLVLAIVLQTPLDLKVRKPESTLLALRLQKRPLKSFAYFARTNITVRLRCFLQTVWQ
jgi:hypothetical protein